MALLMTEGFETLGLKKGWTQILTPTYTAGRFGGSAATVAMQFAVVGGVATCITGFAYRPGAGTFTSSTAVRTLFQVFGSDGTQHLSLLVNVTGQVEARRGTAGSGTLLGTSTTGLTEQIWHYIEVKTVIGDGAGVVVVRVNGATVLNLTGVDTKNGGTGADNTLYTYGGSGANHMFDDVYFCDATGSAPYNDFLGECKIETLFPNGNGASSQLLGSDGNSTDNYLLVDEAPVSATDYVGSAVVGQKDTYQFGNVVTTIGTVLSVQVSAACIKSDAGAANLEIVLRNSGGTEQIVAPQTVPSVLGYVSSGPKTVDPAGAAWTFTSVNAAEFGVRIA